MKDKTNPQPYPIYVIHLKRVPERKLFMQRQFDALQLDYEFVAAIDSNDLRADEYCAETARALGVSKARMRPYLACSLGHIKAYDLMMARNQPAACVLEDDAVLSPDFPEILRAAQKMSWDILMLSSQSRSTRAILACDVGVQNLMEAFPDNDYSLFPLLRHMSWLRRTFPMFFGSRFFGSRFEPRWAVVSKLGWWFLMLLSTSGNFHKINRYFTFSYRHIKSRKRGTYRFNFSEYKGDYAVCKVGALPIRCSQQTLYGSYDIATPAELPSSAMGYLLSLEMARQWKQYIIERGAIVDFVPWPLYLNHGISLKLVTPPCVTASLKYSRMSARRPDPRLDRRFERR